MASSHPYKEPSLTIILVFFGFLFVLNLVNKALDSLLSCGLVGQIFVGVLFGTPGVKLLSNTVETTISDLGYLGLILLVYKGGLSTSLLGLISSSTLAIAVALTGILLPIALSFVLVRFGASPLQCFTAGASLSATSLGTAFATLSSNGLLNTYVGTVLASAAMLDDVVGLIMLQVVAQLSDGHGTAADYGRAIGRALGASVGLVIVVVVTCRFALRPLYTPLHVWAGSPTRSRVTKLIWEGPYTALFLHTALLLALVAAGSLAGTSILLAAFIAGIVVRWWEDEVTGNNETVGLQVFDQYYGPSADRILIPFFFASIGFSIPVAQMFHATTFWKGLIYALLMFLGKAATGLWLVPSSLESATRSRILQTIKSFCQRKENTQGSRVNGAYSSSSNSIKTERKENAEPGGAQCSSPSGYPVSHPSLLPSARPVVSSESTSSAVINRVTSIPQDVTNGPEPSPTTTQPKVTSASLQATDLPLQPMLRAYAPALLGFAMTARGEIGFLIASIAGSHGIFTDTASVHEFPAVSAASGDVDMTSTLYLIVMWAIVLCTVVGPVTVGILARRVQRLDTQTRV